MDERDVGLALFLELLVADAVRHPAELVAAEPLIRRGKRLTEGVVAKAAEADHISQPRGRNSQQGLGDHRGG
jgi:hypothetical protein